MIIVANLIFWIFPIISFPILIIGFIFDRKNYKIYSILLSICLGIISYNLKIESYNLDINRYIATMNNYKGINLKLFIEDILLKNREPLTNILFYLFRRVPKLWLFFISFICYSIVFYIINDICDIKKYNTKKRILFSLLMVLSFNNFFALTGVRNQLAITIFLLAIYLELFKGKKSIWIYLLYIITVLIHSSMILAVVIRLLLIVYNEKTKWIFILGVPISWFLINNILPIIEYVNDFWLFSNFSLQYEYYSGISTDILSNFNCLAYVIILINIAGLYLLYYSKKGTNKKIVSIFFIFLFAVCPYWTILQRWLKLMLMLFIIYIAYTDYKLNKITIINAILICTVLLYIDICNLIEIHFIESLINASCFNFLSLIAI